MRARSRRSSGASSRLRPARPRRLTGRGAGPAHRDARVGRALEGAEAARLPLRRADHRLRLHAGHGAGERSPRRLPRPGGGGAGAGWSTAGLRDPTVTRAGLDCLPGQSSPGPLRARRPPRSRHADRPGQGHLPASQPLPRRRQGADRGLLPCDRPVAARRLAARPQGGGHRRLVRGLLRPPALRPSVRRTGGPAGHLAGPGLGGARLRRDARCQPRQLRGEPRLEPGAGLLGRPDRRLRGPVAPEAQRAAPHLHQRGWRRLRPGLGNASAGRAQPAAPKRPPLAAPLRVAALRGLPAALVLLRRLP